MPSRKTLYWITLVIILAVMLVAMLVMAFQDAVQAGEEPDLVGPLVAWFAIALFSAFFSALAIGAGGLWSKFLELIGRRF